MAWVWAWAWAWKVVGMAMPNVWAWFGSGHANGAGTAGWARATSTARWFDLDCNNCWAEVDHGKSNKALLDGLVWVATIAGQKLLMTGATKQAKKDMLSCSGLPASGSEKELHEMGFTLRVEGWDAHNKFGAEPSLLERSITKLQFQAKNWLAKVAGYRDNRPPHSKECLRFPWYGHCLAHPSHRNFTPKLCGEIVTRHAKKHPMQSSKVGLS
eukprot:1149826-Pelagomonas_calceolata.AAC.4